MATIQDVQNLINNTIKENNNQEITGQVLNNALTAMIDTLSKTYAFGGVATPSTNPSTPEVNTFYLATEAGSYANMGGVELAEGEVALISYNGQTWSSSIIDDVRKLAWYYQRVEASGLPVGFIHKGKNGFLDPAAGWHSTDYIPVKEGESIEVRSAFYGNACIGGFSNDEGGGFVLLAETANNNFQYFRFVVPQGVHFMRVSIYDASTTFCEIHFGTPRFEVFNDLLSRTDIQSQFDSNALTTAAIRAKIEDTEKSYLSVYANPNANANTQLLTKAIRALYLPYLEQGYVISNVGYLQTAQAGNPATFVRVHTFDLSANYTFIFNDIPESGICSAICSNGGYIVVDWTVLSAGYIKTSMTGDAHRVSERCFSPLSFGLGRNSNKYTGLAYQKYKAGYVINETSGAIVPGASTYVVTDFIPVVEGDTLRVLFSPKGAVTYLAGYSDTNGNGFVNLHSGGGRDDDVFEFVVPAGVRFIVIGSSIALGSKKIAVDYSDSVNLSAIADAMRYSLMDNPESLVVNAYNLSAQETATRWLKLEDNATFPSVGTFIGLQNGSVVISKDGVITTLG